ncbi:aminotransferase class I/II-fold pyridoxal phosphate-dependent enzyme [bacterium]|nr:aminotransferase class I/II-fold pyridoxal phosphate-dependent enzyme [bacterium]
MSFNFSNKINKVPPYLFAKIDAKKKEIVASGKRVFDFGVGDPDLPTWDIVIEKLKEYSSNIQYHQYPSYMGDIVFRETIAEYIKKRFNVNVLPEKNIIVLIGSKEGIAHFPFAFVNQGDIVFSPDPAYPVYRDGTYFAGGDIIKMPLLEKNNFLPDVEYFLKKHNPKIVWVNYPNNPIGVTAPDDFYKNLIELAHKYKFIIASDAAYIEIYENEKPRSIFEFDGAMDVAIEFHSFSKMFDMTGWRVGFAVGNETLIEGLGKIKKSIDSGSPTAIQMATKYGLENFISEMDNDNGFMQDMRRIYANRRKKIGSILDKFNIEPTPSHSTFYIWGKMLDGLNSEEKVAELIEKYQILLSPGTGFGESGEGYVRFSLTISDKDIDDLIQIIK